MGRKDVAELEQMNTSLADRLISLEQEMCRARKELAQASDRAEHHSAECYVLRGQIRNCLGVRSTNGSNSDVHKVFLELEHLDTLLSAEKQRRAELELDLV